MKAVQAGLAGFIGGAVASIWMSLFRLAGGAVGWELMLGQAVVGDGGVWVGVVGFGVHMACAVLLGVVQAAILAGLRGSTRLLMGLLVGAVQALVVGVLVDVLLPEGPFLVERGERVATGFALAHVWMGAVVAVLTDERLRLHTRRFRAWTRLLRRRRMPGARVSALQRHVPRRTRRHLRTIPPIWAFPPHA